MPGLVLLKIVQWAYCLCCVVRGGMGHWRARRGVGQVCEVGNDFNADAQAAGVLIIDNTFVLSQG